MGAGDVDALGRGAGGAVNEPARASSATIRSRA